jgi:hypothetical protein
VVSDVLMPKLDGFSLCHEIKRDVAVRDVPVILLSWKEDLLQRVRELGGDADGYLRKEAAASTVVERLREVLRARARVEQRVASGGEVRGRLDGLTPRLVLELACRAQRDARVSIRDSSYLYEVQVRAGAPRTAIRSANDGSFERGEGVLAMLLGVSAGRFVIEPDDSHCRAELSGSLHEQLAAPVARARAAQRALSAGALASVTRVAFDAARVGGYLECTPEPAQSLLRELITGASPRDLLTTGRAPARLLEAVLSDFARRGGILMVETASGVEDISQTRVPPTVAPPLAALSIPEPEAGAAVPSASPTTTPGLAPAMATPLPVIAPGPIVAPAPDPEAAPVSQRKPPAIYSQPPDAELAQADEGWFSFQIESSAKPPAAAPLPEVAVDAPPPTDSEPVSETDLEADAAPAGILYRSDPPRPRAEDPLRRTLSSSSAPPADEDDELPGASVPVERGHRPEFRLDTLGSAGNEAAAALAAVAEGDDEVVAVVGSELADVEAVDPEPVKSAPRPVPKPPRPVSPTAPHVLEDDPLAQALLVDTPPPAAVAPVGFGQTLPLEGAPAPAKAPKQESVPAPATAPAATAPAATAPAGTPADAQEGRERSPWRADVSTQPPKAAVKTQVMPVVKAPAAARPAKQAPAPAGAESDAGGLGRTLLFAAIAAGVSYFGVTALFGNKTPPPPAQEAPSAVTPVPMPVVSSALAPAAPKLKVTVSESPLPAGTEVPQTSGLLEIQVPDGTAIRVDGEYLGMGPGRRVPLAPGAHQLTLGDGVAQEVSVKQGQRTFVVATDPAAPAPAGSP